MSFLDDVLGGLESTAAIVKQGQEIVNGFAGSGTSSVPPTVDVPGSSAGMSTTTWVLIGLGGAVLLYLVLKKKG